MIFGFKTKKDRKIEELQSKIDYLEKVEIPNSKVSSLTIKAFGSSVMIDSMSSIPENCIKRDLGMKMVCKLIDSNSLEISKEVCQESGKTIYKCNLYVI